MVWMYAYRFDSHTSTCIVECSPETWEGLGFDELEPDESIALLEKIFERYLDGHPLIDKRRPLGKTPWLNFRHISNERWCHDNIVLMGDAAHTTHFTIGSGTKLAFEDAIGLAEKLHEYQELQDALKAYVEERRAALLGLQSAASDSARWFENVQRHIDQEAIYFAYSLVNRRPGKTNPEEIPWHYHPYLPARGMAALRRLRRRLRRWSRSAQRELRAGRSP